MFYIWIFTLAFVTVATAIDVKKACMIAVELSDGMINVMNQDELCSCLKYEKATLPIYKAAEPCHLSTLRSGGKLMISTDSMCECAGYQTYAMLKNNTTSLDSLIYITTGSTVTDDMSSKSKIMASSHTSTTENIATDVNHLSSFKIVDVLNSTVITSETPKGTNSKTNFSTILYTNDTKAIVNHTKKYTNMPIKYSTFDKYEKLNATTTYSIKSNSSINSSVIKREITDTTKSLSSKVTDSIDTTNITEVKELTKNIVSTLSGNTKSLFYDDYDDDDDDGIRNKTVIPILKVNVDKADNRSKSTTNNDIRGKTAFTNKLTIQTTTEIEYCINCTVTDEERNNTENTTKMQETDLNRIVTKPITIFEVNATQTSVTNYSNVEKHTTIGDVYNSTNIALIVILTLIAVVLLIMLLAKIINRCFRKGSYVVPHSIDRNIEMESKQ